MPIKKTVKNISTVQKLNGWLERFSMIPFVQKMLFIHHLQIMTKAGLSIVNSLKILSEEIDNKRLRAVVAAVRAEVETGKQLSEAMALFPRVFPPIYVSMIGAGETAGKMEDALKNIYEQMRKSHDLRSKVRGAMIYPAVIVVAMGGIAIEVVVVILHKIMVMFEDFDAELPLATRALIALTKFIQSYGIWLLVGLIAFIILTRYLSQRPAIKPRLHAFNLRLPVFGNIIKKINLAGFTLTLSSLLSSAIPIIDAVKTAALSQSNLAYRIALDGASESLKKGDPLSSILARAPHLFPPMVTEMVMVGEETGQVEHMLSEMSEYYAADVDNTMKNFSTVIEPVIILFLGLAVAGIAVAVIMPMYSLAQNF